MNILNNLRDGYNLVNELLTKKINGFLITLKTPRPVIVF